MQADRTTRKPRVGVTLGDVNGIGPEVAVRAVLDPRVQQVCQPVVVGCASVLQRAVDLLNLDVSVEPIEPRNGSFEEFKASVIPCWTPEGIESPEVRPTEVTAAAGRFAHDCLRSAASATGAGMLDAIATAPLNKAALSAAGIPFPGHTEILADQFGVDDFAMMLHLSASALAGTRTLIGPPITADHGVAIAHVTLHTSIRSVPGLLTSDSILEKIALVDRFLQQLGIGHPSIGVCALNPHAGEGGLFGGEESAIIEPAVSAAHAAGIVASGPFPTDTLIRRAILGEFQGVVAMYHDQGHIPVKLIGFDSAINVTLGIPIVRTSPTHGTAFDIAWRGSANAAGMIEAMLLAARLSSRDCFVE